ncbi:MAG: chloride channel protein [Elusimicrobiota bacterium]
MAQSDRTDQDLNKKTLSEVPAWAQAALRNWIEVRGWTRSTFKHYGPMLAPSETKFLVVLSVLIGLFTGTFTYVFDIMIRKVSHLGLGGSPFSLTDVPLWSRWKILFFPAIGGLIVGPIIKNYSPESKGHGVPEVMLAMHQQGGRIRGRVAALKAFCSAMTIGTGGSAGREGPIVQIGASIGSYLAQRFRLPPVTLKTMAAAGSAAGIAAAFNAPLGGMAFAMEIILGEISAAPFAMVVLSTVVASSVSRGLHGASAYFSVPHYRLIHSGELVLYLILGVLAGITSKLFVRALYAIEDEFDLRLKIDDAWKPAVGGLLVGALGFFVPGALGAGYLVIEQALTGAFTMKVLLLLLLTKTLSTSLTLGSGGSGGVFMPSLFCGAMLGGLFGAVMSIPFPGIVDPGAYAMVGMAAFVGGATHAPLTAILILFEMTNDYSIILPLMVSVVAAVMTARTFEPESIYTMKLARRGIQLNQRPDTSLLNVTPISEIMTRKVITIEHDFPIGKLGRHFNKTKRTGFPVVDKDDRLVGMVTYAETQAAYDHEPPPPSDLPIEKIMRTAGKPLYADDPAGEVIRRMNIDGIDHLPIVDREDSRKIIGIVSRTDLLQLYSRRIT